MWASRRSVLELQVQRVGQVHLGLRRAVDEQDPRIRPVEIGDQLGQAGGHLLVDGDPPGPAPSSRPVTRHLTSIDAVAT